MKTRNWLQNMLRYIIGLMLFLSLMLVVGFFPVNSADNAQALLPLSASGTDIFQKIRQVGSIGGEVNRVMVQGNYAYVGEGGTFKIFNIQQSDSPQLQATLSLTDVILGMRITTNYAYLATGTSGLQIVTIQDPSLPELVGTYPTQNDCVDVWIDDTTKRAYVADKGTGLHIVDMSNPHSPEQIGYYSLPTIRQVQVVKQGNETLAFIAAYTEGLQVLNVTNPTSPSFVWSVPIDFATGVLVDDTYAYVAAGYDGVFVIDRLSQEIHKHIYVYGNSNGYVHNVVQDGTNLYLANGVGGVQFLPMANIHDTKDETARVLFEGTDVQWIAKDATSDDLYIADKDAGWHIMDVADSQSVDSSTIVSNTVSNANIIDVADSQNDESDTIYSSDAIFGSVYGIEVDEQTQKDIVYVAAGRRGFQRVFVASRNTPSLMTEPQATQFMPQQIYTAYNVDVYDQGQDVHAYATYGAAGVHTFEIRDNVGLAPFWQKEGSLPTVDQNCYDVQADEHNQRTYIATSKGVLIFDTIAPYLTNLLAGYVSKIAPAYGIALNSESPLVYIAGKGGIEIINVEEPAQPKRVGEHSLTIARALDIETIESTTYAYVAAGTQGLVILDVSQPEAIEELATWSPLGEGNIYSVHVVEQQAFVADYRGAIHILDVSTPATPQLIVSQDIVGAARDIQFVNGAIYVATEGAGLQIWQSALDVTIDGLEEAPIGVRTTFQALVRNNTNNQSLTYTWFPKPTEGQGTAQATYEWDDAGEETIQVEVTTTEKDRYGGATHKVDVYDDVTIDLIGDERQQVPLNATSTFQVVVPDKVKNHPETVYTWNPDPTLGQNTAKVLYQWGWEAVNETTPVQVKVELGNILKQATHTHAIAVRDDGYEKDGDNTCDNARAVVSHGIVERHTMGTNDDEDWIKLEPSAGIPQTYLLAITTPSGAPANLLYEVKSSCDTNSSNHIPTTPADAGTVVFEIASGGKAYIKIYADNTTPLDAAYVYDISLDPIVQFPDDSYEPDNSCFNAQQIATDGTMQEHTISYATDEDWVFFNARKDQRYLIDIQSPSSSHVDAVLDIYEQCQDAPAEHVYYAFAPGIAAEYRSDSERMIYLKIQNFKQDRYGEKEEYIVSVRELGNEKLAGGTLLIVAGRLKDNDPVQSNIYTATKQVKKTFEEHKEDNDFKTYLLSPEEVDEANQSTVENLQAKFEEIANNCDPQYPLTMYLIDHGDENIFYLDNTKNEILKPEKINELLDSIEAKCPSIPINVIIDACSSGTFLDDLSHPGRVIITSTNDNNAFASENSTRFTEHFLIALGKKQSLHSAFKYSKEIVENANDTQQPQLDDNGDGIYVEGSDGTVANNRGFDYQNTLGENWPPYIEAVTVFPKPIHEGQEFDVTAIVLDDKNIDRMVWADVYTSTYVPTPSDNSLIREEPLLELDFTACISEEPDNCYTASHTFEEAGIYDFVIQAQDNQDAIARPVRIAVPVSSKGITLTSRSDAGDTTSFLVGEKTTFTIATSQTQSLQWNWDFGDGTQVTTTSMQMTHGYTQEGEYDVSCSIFSNDVYSDALEMKGVTQVKVEKPNTLQIHTIGLTPLGQKSFVKVVWDEPVDQQGIIKINFGDGSDLVTRTIYPDDSPLIVWHTYTKAQKYVVTAHLIEPNMPESDASTQMIIVAPQIKVQTTSVTTQTRIFQGATVPFTVTLKGVGQGLVKDAKIHVDRMIYNETKNIEERDPFLGNSQIVEYLTFSDPITQSTIYTITASLHSKIYGGDGDDERIIASDMVEVIVMPRKKNVIPVYLPMVVR